MLRVSVVATGMDGLSISAIEPAPLRRSSRRSEAVAAEPAPAFQPESIAADPAPVLPEPEPVFAMVEPEPEPQPIPTPVVEPVVAEPVRHVASQSGRTFKAPEPEIRFEAPPEPRQAPEPRAAQPPAARPVARIVDPSVADDEDEPLFADTTRFGHERPQKSSWLSIFGRPRHDAAPQPQLRTAATRQAQPALEEAADEADDDLEIPSFLRRLAN
jgi:cell division protein FtsZ